MVSRLLHRQRASLITDYRTAGLIPAFSESVEAYFTAHMPQGHSLPDLLSEGFYFGD